MSAHEFLGGACLGAALLVTLQKLAGQLADHRFEDLVLVLEVVVEGARRQVGVTHDVAYTGGTVAALGEHRARGFQQGGAVLRLVLLAPSGAAGDTIPACGIAVPAHGSSSAPSGQGRGAGRPP